MLREQVCHLPKFQTLEVGFAMRVPHGPCQERFEGVDVAVAVLEQQRDLLDAEAVAGRQRSYASLDLLRLPKSVGLHGCQRHVVRRHSQSQ